MIIKVITLLASMITRNITPKRMVTEAIMKINNTDTDTANYEYNHDNNANTTNSNGNNNVNSD